MRDNPYESRTGLPGSGIRRALLMVGCPLCGCLVLASAAAFAWMTVYRLKNTDVFGRSTTPPPIPLEVADFVLLATFAAATFFAVLWLAAVLAINDIQEQRPPTR